MNDIRAHLVRLLAINFELVYSLGHLLLLLLHRFCNLEISVFMTLSMYVSVEHAIDILLHFLDPKFSVYMLDDNRLGVDEVVRLQK